MQSYKLRPSLSLGWKYIGDYIYIKSNFALDIRFLTHDWKLKANNFVELVEQI